MRPLTQAEQKDWRIMQVIAFALGILAPIIYLGIAWTVEVTDAPEAGADMIFYILLVFALVQPAAAALVTKVQISQYRRSPGQLSPSKFFINLSIIKLALVEAIFVYGLVVMFMTGDFNRMLYFYPIGAIWLAVYWPRKEKYAAFVEEFESGVTRS